MFKSSHLGTVAKEYGAYTSYLNGVPISTHRSATAAQEALKTLIIALKLMEDDAKTKAEARKTERAEPLPPPSQNLPTGIYQKGRRFVVSSPKYLGSFLTLEEAVSAQASFPRKYKKYKPRAEKIPFEERTWTL